jgi:N utilization substance protein B
MSAEEIFALSGDNREIADDEYVKETYFGVRAHLDEIDAIVSRHAKGWKTYRMSRVSRSVIRLCVYEMIYLDSIPVNVSLNEAVELSKKYDEDKARPFVNGVLNAIKDELASEAAKSEQ